MPFDGGDLSQFQFSGPSASEPLGLRAKLAWLWRSPLDGRGVRSLLPGQGGQFGERQAVCLLRAARSLIETEETWTRGAYCTRDGRHCAVGALRAAAVQGQYGRKTRQEAHGLLLGLARQRGFSSVEGMNDSSTYGQVLAIFDSAIGIAESRPVFA